MNVLVNIKARIRMKQPAPWIASSIKSEIHKRNRLLIALFYVIRNIFYFLTLCALSEKVPQIRINIYLSIYYIRHTSVLFLFHIIISVLVKSYFRYMV